VYGNSEEKTNFGNREEETNFVKKDEEMSDGNDTMSNVAINDWADHGSYYYALEKTNGK
jgi:hypothetical protein